MDIPDYLSGIGPTDLSGPAIRWVYIWRHSQIQRARSRSDQPSACNRMHGRHCAGAGRLLQHPLCGPSQAHAHDNRHEIE